MQMKLNDYFKLTINHNENYKKCFIYDPTNRNAFFSISPLETDTYITCKSTIKLYYRKPTNAIAVPDFPIINTTVSIPLLKSNLQKAVRRQNTQIAVNSALALIQKDKIEFLRRLPIIYIEDVCLIDSYTIVVWLMMCDKEYTLTNLDIYILLNIIHNLCVVNEFYWSHDGDKNEFKITHEHLQNHVIGDQLLALYYRSEYGGLKGDMIMLRNSIYHYYNNPTDYVKASYNLEITNIFKWDKCFILNEAVDFHPFPHIIKTLVKQTGLKYEEIKMCIWFAESGINYRKPETLEASKKYLESYVWQQIKYKLRIIRFHLLQS